MAMDLKVSTGACCVHSGYTAGDKEFSWGLDYSFRCLVSHHHGGWEHGGRQAGIGAVAESCILICQQRGRGDI